MLNNDFSKYLIHLCCFDQLSTKIIVMINQFRRLYYLELYDRGTFKMKMYLNIFQIAKDYNSIISKIFLSTKYIT